MPFELPSSASTPDARAPLRALLRKYEALHALRVQNTPEQAPADGLAAIAREFPGALRALDLLPMAELTARRDELSATLCGGREPSAWMQCELVFHGYMRAALRIRALLRARGNGDLPGHAGALGYAPEPGEPPPERFDQEALGALQNPPGGRLEAWLLGRAAAELGLPVSALERALYPWRSG
jgi:hypothetical protein